MRRLSSTRKTFVGRRGAAAVELAIASPVLVLLLLGTLDLGQFVNMGEVISNTSRVTARKAARSSSLTNLTIREAAIDYLDNHFPHVDRTRLETATTVTVKNGSGTALTDAQLEDVVRSGDQMIVTVSFDFAQIRWVGGGLPFLNNSTLSATTTIRRL